MRRATEANPVSLNELRSLAQSRFGDMIKGVVDLKRGLLLLDAELHADQEAALLAEGSTQEDLWGINIYPDEEEEHFVEFDSLINIRPTLGNRTRSVEDDNLRQRIRRIVMKRVER